MTHPETLPLRQFCDHIGVKPSYGAELKKTGRLVLAEDGKTVLVAQSIARIEETRDPSKAGVAARHAAERGAAARTGHAETELNQVQAHADSAQAATETIAPTTAPQPPEGEGAARGYDYQNSKAKREHFAAMEAEASYRQKMRELLDAGEVRAAMVEVLTVLRTSIEGLPYNLAPVLAATSDEAQIKSLMSAEVEHALKTAADSLAKLGRGEL